MYQYDGAKDPGSEEAAEARKDTVDEDEQERERQENDSRNDHASPYTIEDSEEFRNVWDADHRPT